MSCLTPGIGIWNYASAKHVESQLLARLQAKHMISSFCSSPAVGSPKNMLIYKTLSCKKLIYELILSLLLHKYISRLADYSQNDHLEDGDQVSWE